MKSTKELMPIFNDKAAIKPIFTFHFRGQKCEITIERLKRLQEKPIVFVFAQINNAWAQDFIHQFKAALSEWVPGGQFPPPIFIITTECRGDLQERLMFQPQIAAGEISFIVSIGDMASAEVVRFRLAHNRTDLPQLFCVTGDPDRLDLTTVDGLLVANTNGVCSREVDSYAKPLRVLKSLSSSVKSIAIVYGRKSRFDLMANQKELIVKRIIAECAKQGLSAQQLLIDEESDYAVDFAHIIGKVDAFLTLQDTTVYTKTSELTAFCAQHKIVYLASELASVMRGASLGFGQAPVAFVSPLIGLMAMQRATHQPLHVLEIAAIKESTQMWHNMNNIRQQVADLTQEKADLLEMCSIVNY